MWFPLSSVWEQGPLGNEFCRLENNNKKDLDWWHKKEVIEFKVMQKPRAMCMK